jgi:nitric oxide reductase NorQ protein
MIPYYRAVGDELALFQRCYEQRLPLLLKGPTGCGKSRSSSIWRRASGDPLITVACHDDTSAVDLLGRWSSRGATRCGRTAR